MIRQCANLQDAHHAFLFVSCIPNEQGSLHRVQNLPTLFLGCVLRVAPLERDGLELGEDRFQRMLESRYHPHLSCTMGKPLNRLSNAWQSIHYVPGR